MNSLVLTDCAGNITATQRRSDKQVLQPIVMINEAIEFVKRRQEARVELSIEQQRQTGEYMSAFDVLIGDERTERTFRGMIEGIIGGGSVRAGAIARFSPVMANIKNAERRVRRPAEGESTQRSRLDAVSVTKVMREQGAATLRGEEEITLVMDGMELRREGAQEQENPMEVKALDLPAAYQYPFSCSGELYGEHCKCLFAIGQSHLVKSCRAGGVQQPKQKVNHILLIDCVMGHKFFGAGKWATNCYPENWGLRENKRP